MGTLIVLMMSLVSGGQMQPANPVAPVGQTGNWSLIFHDEFEGNTLDDSRWVTCYWWDNNGCTNEGNNELQWYLPENIIVQDGALHLRAIEQEVTGSNGKVYPYTSGMVTTGSVVDDPEAPTKFVFTYGYAEIRAWVPRGQGLWPAFWLLPAAQVSRPEIDVLEILGHDTSSLRVSLHYLDFDDRRQRVYYDYSGPDFADGWHTYAVDWSPEALVWYIDGVEIWRYDQEPYYIPDVSMYMLLNLAVGGDWPGDPNDDTPFPSDYKIDFVRVWKRLDPPIPSPVPLPWEPTSETPAQPPIVPTSSNPPPTCADTQGNTNPLVRANIASGSIPSGGVYCNILAENGTFTHNPGEIGDTSVLNMGVIHAVDVYAIADNGSPITYFSLPIEICLQGGGTLVFLSATQSPRVPQLVPTWSSGGYSCTTLPNAGTLVLVANPIV